MSKLNLSLNQVCTDYLNSVRYERGCSQATYYTYSSWLHHFQNWLKDKGYAKADLSQFNPGTLRTYQYSLSARKLRPRTIRAAFHPLRGLGKFLIEHQLLTENPCESLTMPKKDAAIRKTISTEEIAALLLGVERLHPPQKVTLARAMLHTLVYAGVRFQELLDIKVGDVNIGNGTVLVSNGKGSKSRLLYPPKPCMDAIHLWLEARDKRCSHDWLWAENRGRRMGELGVRDLLEEVKAVAGLREHDNIKPHSLRHAFATRMMQNGAPIKAIQSALGHSLVDTTFQYLHLEEQETRRMADFATLNLARHPTEKREKEEKKPSRANYQQMRRVRVKRTPAYA